MQRLIIGLLCLLFVTEVSFASIGKITALRGNVSVLRDNKTLTARAGFGLEEHDTVKSAKNAVAQLVFNDNTIITVGSATQFNVAEYSSDPKAPKASFHVAVGTFKSVTGAIGKIAPDKFRLTTKTATIGVRGTTLTGEVEQNGNTTVACLVGAITVTAMNGETVVVPAGFYTMTIAGIAPQPPARLTPKQLRELSRASGTSLPQTSQSTPVTSSPTQTQPDGVGDLVRQAVSADITTALEKTIQAAHGAYARWAPTYDGATYIPGVSYMATGNATNISTDGVSSGYALQFNLAIPGKTALVYQDPINLANPNTPTVVDGVLSSIASEDSFSLTETDQSGAGITYTTKKDDAGADYVSWGYWQTTATDQNNMPQNYGYWVAGALTTQADMQHLIANSVTADYKGNVMGNVVDSTNATVYSILMDSTNSATFHVDFGSSQAVSGTIQFNTSNNQNWNVNFSANNAITSSSSSFRINGDISGNAINGTGGMGMVSSIGGIDGNFYGPQAASVGGTFKFVSGSSTASGAFKANKQ